MLARIAVLLLVLVAPAVRACQCMLVSAEDAVRNPDLVVFAGRVTRLVTLLGREHAVIEVSRTWGQRTPSVVLMPLQVDSCGHPDVWSTVPSDWLFVAGRDGFGRYDTNNCLGSLRMVDASATLLHLGPGERPTPIAPMVVGPLGALLVAAALWFWRAARRRRAR